MTQHEDELKCCTDCEGQSKSCCLVQISKEIEGEITAADKITAKIEEALVDIKCITRDEQRRAESRITSPEGSVSPMPSSPSASEEESDNEVYLPPKVRKSRIKLKLPKLVLPKFNGDVTQFRSLWDSFKSAIDGNKDLSKIDKFNYLRALLEGAASRAIQGLPLSKAN